MKEKVGALLATATIVSGCDQDLSGIFERPTADNVIEYSFSQIHAEQLSDTLPPGVEEQIPNVVAITSEIHSYNSELQRVISTSICSGVRIDEHDYLSAGHCADLRNISKGLTPYCMDIRVDIPTNQSDGVTLDGTKQAGYSPEGTSATSLQFLNYQDILLIETEPGNQPSYDKPTHFRDKSDTVKQGTPLYFANYQPTENREYRNPSKEALLPPQHSRGPHTPAILGGIAIRTVNPDTIEVVTAGDSYGTSKDTDIRMGASGGPVYDKIGNLVGRIVVTDANKMSVKAFENSRNIEIAGMPDEEMLRILYVKTSSQEQVNKLQDEQQTLPRCQD